MITQFFVLGLLGLAAAARKPNIIYIMTDDQDLHLGSLDYMPTVQKLLVQQGTTFDNHYATVAQCCPSRTSILRGQAAHNHNITDVKAPGGNYDKWLLSNLDADYLPDWLNDAGYNTNYFGKFLNGHNLRNYKNPPKSWNHVDALVDPYVYTFNNVVMSENGERPKQYNGFHQSDVLRIKALHRLKTLVSRNDEPFFMAIAPAAPHMEEGEFPTPCKRHKGMFHDVGAPRTDNFNPSDANFTGVVSWLKKLPFMNQEALDTADKHFRARIQILQSIDDMVEDIVHFLEKHNILDNTYIIYTTDNGYHIGNHRVPAGKSLPYREDTNLPFIVRGPGVPKGVRSSLPSAHIDLAPTFLEIAGKTKAEFPSILDGRSLLSNWKNPQKELASCPMPDQHEIINVEFWGGAGIEGPHANLDFSRSKSSYKTLRIVGGEGNSYLFSRWCTNETELYDTNTDPAELRNLALHPRSDEDGRLIRRLNALLLATKSCADETCRNPWRVLQPEPERRGKVVPQDELTIDCLSKAMEPQYDDFFRSIPHVTFQECLQVQEITNERPFWPESEEPELGRDHRESVGQWDGSPGIKHTKVPPNNADAGGKKQRHVEWEKMMSRAKDLTDHQLGIGLN